MAKSNSEWDQKYNQQSDFLVQYLYKGEPVNPCMDVYKAKIQSDGSLDNLKLRIAVRWDIQNK